MDSDKLKAFEEQALVAARQFVEAVRGMPNESVDTIMAAMDAPIRQQVEQVVTLFEAMALQSIDTVIVQLSEAAATVLEKQSFMTGKQAAEIVRSAARETINS